MAITTLDGALAGMQPPVAIAKAVGGTMVAGRPHSFYQIAGNPGAGALNGTLNGAALSSSSTIPNGIIRHVDPVSGNAHLARLAASVSQPGVLLLCDRLWDNTSAIATGAQSITFPGLPARDNAGTTNGDGVLAAVECITANSATAAAVTLTYTNQAGTASRTASFSDATAATATTVGDFHRIGLQAGDTGIRSIQSVNFTTAWTSGTLGLVLYRVLAQLEIVAANVGNAIDALTGGFPRLYNGTCPFLVFVPSTTTSSNITGTYLETQG